MRYGGQEQDAAYEAAQRGYGAPPPSFYVPDGGICRRCGSTVCWEDWADCIACVQSDYRAEMERRDSFRIVGKKERVSEPLKPLVAVEPESDERKVA